MIRNRKLRLEGLEERWTPAVSVLTNAYGDVTVSGNADGAVVITQTADGEYEVTDNGNAIGGTHVGTRDLIVRLGNAADDVTIDLGGFTVPDDLCIYLGRGNNTLAIDNGTVADDLVISTLTGQDTVTLGGSAGLIADDISVNLNGSGDDILTVDDVQVGDDFFSYYANDFTLGSAAIVGDDLRILGGTAGNKVIIDGSVGHDLLFQGSQYSNVSDDFTLGVTGTVGRDLVLYTDSIWLNRGGNDVVTLAGSVDNDVFLNAGGGNDDVTLESTFTMQSNNRLRIYTGHGNDTLTVNLASYAPGTFGTLDGGAHTTGDTYVGPAVVAPLTKVNFEL